MSPLVPHPVTVKFVGVEDGMIYQTPFDGRQTATSAFPSPSKSPPAPEAGTLIALKSRVTAPVSAKTLPATLVPVVTVSLMCARMLPTKTVLVPRVAELPTCQNTFPAVAPLARTTEELLAV